MMNTHYKKAWLDKHGRIITYEGDCDPSVRWVSSNSTYVTEVKGRGNCAIIELYDIAKESLYHHVSLIETDDTNTRRA